MYFQPIKKERFKLVKHMIDDQDKPKQNMNQLPFANGVMLLTGYKVGLYLELYRQQSSPNRLAHFLCYPHSFSLFFEYLLHSLKYIFK
jgi:hypothetical protein